MRDELHSLFMAICKIGIQLHEQEKDIEAHGILMKLVIALEKYPGLCDTRKRGALLEIARFYQDIGDQDEREWLLGKAAQIDNAPALHENTYRLLVQSLKETSERANDVVLKLWDNNFMDDGPSLAIPPIHRSAQHSNAAVASMMLAETNSNPNSSPASFDLKGLHVAAALGFVQNVTNFLRAGAQVDVFDIHHHTALFLAALKGHEGCCAVLIGKSRQS